MDFVCKTITKNMLKQEGGKGGSSYAEAVKKKITDKAHRGNAVKLSRKLAVVHWKIIGVCNGL